VVFGVLWSSSLRWLRTPYHAGLGRRLRAAILVGLIIPLCKGLSRSTIQLDFVFPRNNSVYKPTWPFPVVLVVTTLTAYRDFNQGFSGVSLAFGKQMGGNHTRGGKWMGRTHTMSSGTSSCIQTKIYSSSRGQRRSLPHHKLSSSLMEPQFFMTNMNGRRSPA
jgi:hypothetical protein